VLRWQIGNAVLELSNTEQMKIQKGKAKDKIDTIIAMIMATGEMLFGEREKASVYTSQQGIRSV
jgi:phage terminase large subunit-like protein